MTKAQSAPTYFISGMDDGLAANIRVVDAKSGEIIPGVIEADIEKGKVRRFKVEDGNYVREGDCFKIVDEKRDIRIEWIALGKGEALVDVTDGHDAA